MAACSAAPLAPKGPRPDAVEAKAAAFVDAFSSFAPWPLQDGRVLFLSTRDGIPALYPWIRPWSLMTGSTAS